MTVLLGLSPSHTASAANCNILAISGVTASGSQTGNPPTNAIDANLSTRWSNLGKGSSITVDFGKERAICSVNISWYQGNQRINDFVIAVSNDGQSFNTVFSGKSTGNTAQFENYDFPDTTGRYVKITVNGNTVNNWASISEIRVLGDLISASPTPPTILNTNPSSGATNVPTSISKITATFNEPIMASSVSASTFAVKAAGSSAVLPGTYSLSNNDGGKTIVFTLSTALNVGTTYTATLTGGIKDQGGDSLASPATWSFSTVAESPNPPPPTNDCNGLSISKVSESGGTHSLGPKYAIDGKLDTRWSMQGAGSTITMDIGKKHVICNVDISWYRGTERISNFVISLSKDAKSFTNVFSGTSSGGTDGFERYNFPDASARYIKITVNGNTLNNWASINEIRVFGDPTTTPPPPPPPKQEICGDGIDNNGNGQIDEGCSPPPPPPKQEICGDGIDNNGNGQIDEGCSTPPPPPPGSDGVKEIYPTAPGGATWFFNPDNPIDGQFDPNGAQISKNSDGSWHLKPGTTRMLTFPKSDGMLSDSFRSNLPTYDYSQLAQIGYWYKPTDWKNTEITGYFKVTASNSGDGISLVTRSVRHSTSVHNGCGGSAYHNNIKFDGTFQYKKEMWHVNYDTLPPTKNGIGSIMNKWVGFKGIVYNLPNGNVKLESYVDKDANNNWQKVEELVDSGNWGNDMTHCGANKPGAQITWTSPMPIFKSNGVTYDFKKLSVREIVPPS